MPFTFNAVELCVVTVNGKPWARAREVCKALEYNKKAADIIIVVRKTMPRGIKWVLSPQWGHLWIGQRIRKNTIFALMRKGCMSCYFQVNNQRQKTSEETAAMCCSLILDSSLQTERRRIINRPLRRSRESINKPLKKKMQ